MQSSGNWDAVADADADADADVVADVVASYGACTGHETWSVVRGAAV